MKTIKKFIIGSRYFFDKYDDYKVKDNDELHLMDNWIIDATNVLNMRQDGQDIFYYRNMSKEEFIQEVLDTKNYLKLGKFLIPEFNKEIGFTIEDLKKIKSLFEHVDDKHKYQISIVKSYINNNDFTLTNEQLDISYNIYKNARKKHDV